MEPAGTCWNLLEPAGTFWNRTRPSAEDLPVPPKGRSWLRQHAGRTLVADSPCGQGWVHSTEAHRVSLIAASNGRK
eukprot:15438650-Alexandrium_andersonii.AAC.1